MLTAIVLVHLGCLAVFLLLAARAPIIEDMDDTAPAPSLNATVPDDPPARLERQSPRKRALLGARIVFNNRSTVLDCIVRDISDTGARLVFGRPVTLPEEFELEIGETGQQARARVAWSRGIVCGVMFLDGEQAVQPLVKAWNEQIGRAA